MSTNHNCITEQNEYNNESQQDHSTSVTNEQTYKQAEKKEKNRYSNLKTREHIETRLREQRAALGSAPHPGRGPVAQEHARQQPQFLVGHVG